MVSKHHTLTKIGFLPCHVQGRASIQGGPLRPTRVPMRSLVMRCFGVRPALLECQPWSVRVHRKEEFQLFLLSLFESCPQELSLVCQGVFIQ